MKVDNLSKLTELLESKETNLIHESNTSIYLSTTSNVKGMLNVCGKKNKVLSVGSTGAQGFEALLNGATKVDLFDINQYQKYYYEYLKTAIMYLEHEEFIKYFTVLELKRHISYEIYENLLSHELYYKIGKYLEGETKLFFDYIYTNYNDNSFIFSSLFRYNYNLYVNHLNKMASFYNKEEYYKLKNILIYKDVINYKICSIENLKENFSESYDLILLDNILNYYLQMENLNTKEKIINYIETDLTSMLNENGLLQATYLFKCGTNYFNLNTKGIPTSDFSEIINKNNYKEKELSYDLYTKYNYEVNYVDGVEDFFTKKTNAVMTKTRKK